MQDDHTALAQLRSRLRELEQSWPKHSVTMAMALEREDLEEAIGCLERAILDKQRASKDS